MKPKNVVDMIWNKNGYRMVVTEKKTSQIIYIDGWLFLSQTTRKNSQSVDFCPRNRPRSL